MAKTFFYAVILLAIISQGMTLPTHTNTTKCNAESCIFPDRDESEYCSKALVFLDCIDHNIVDNKECTLFDQEGGRTVIFLAKYAMLLKECPDIPGSFCDLKQCTPPNDQEDDACQKAHDYQRCLVEKIIEHNECALFEKGAAVSMLVMTGLRFPNCDEGEGHSWVEDNENAFHQATTVLLYLVQSNGTETSSGPKYEEKFEHFGSELCDQELDNKKEWKAFGPEWIKDVEVKPRSEYLEPQDSVQAERDGILGNSDDTDRAGDVDLQDDFEQFRPNSDTAGEISKEEINQFQQDSETACEIKEDITQFQPDSETACEIKEDITQFQPDSETACEIKEDITQFQPDSETACEIKEDITQFQPDSETAGEIKEDITQFQPDSETACEIKEDITQFQPDSETACEIKEDITQFQPDSETAGEIKEDITVFKPDSDAACEIKDDITQFKPDSETASKIKEDITQFKPYSDMTRETAQQEIKQYKPDSYRAGEASSQDDPTKFNPDSFTTGEATKRDTQRLTQESKTANVSVIQKDFKETCTAEPDARTHPSQELSKPLKCPAEPDARTLSSQALSKPLKFGLRKRDRRPQQKSPISKMA